MTILEQFDRFPHTGVRRDLIRLKEGLQKRGFYEFGSSGEGELLTVRAGTVTAYARKYKQENTAEAVIEAIRAFNT